MWRTGLPVREEEDKVDLQADASCPLSGQVRLGWVNLDPSCQQS